MDKPVNRILINREGIQDMLGGISRTTFYRKREEWKSQGTPFPEPDSDYHPIQGGALYKYDEVMRFFESKGYLTQDNM
ncbi:helix-turn-helix domain-containing protein [Xenorhabdus bovienii]|uniref:helix-turn-helix domain-containing protein n=1 Tax=Xenorhabdus bovienii TaxID=40576 RepID=UPI002157DB9F|nr:helix-turn-helix domain-containing protein [Xenorhabdus bovienii]MDE1487289.1 helix-turn-helix domain-containing protein [Xenorhabdus bovienii]MDE9440051.1 helix-turn-helix domain-containing protein [Xenorhabdus bovienii]MDE9461449.1 helix-turn-helix domain-containing protein [Xenorhabdus bovienii]MDE9478207.1 helix-turn-helix domain-containing protein [Xenorhabdus bovienii]MDE9531018.1 helix-turn-helix domain-containing protein [Xenorhabdus bovienii]